MVHSSRQFLLKPKSFGRFFSGLFPVSDRCEGKGIDEDWEIIEFLDEQNFSGEGESSGDEKVIECGDDSYIPFPSLYPPANKYTILSKVEVLRLLEEKISRFSSVFLLSKSEATTVLRHFKWNVMKAEDEWLVNEEKVRKAIGLFMKPVAIASASERVCGICYGNSLSTTMLGVSCGHQFCHPCWAGYISEAICDGPGCLNLRCPGESCDAAVGWDLIKLLSSEEEKKKFEHYVIRSCLIGNREAKWCPAPGCEYAVFLIADGDDCAVTCRCSYRFCWNCTKEVHTPVDCGTVDKWVSEISVQSKNQLLANTEPGPTCRCPVQLNQDGEYSECTCFKSFGNCAYKQSTDPDRDDWDWNCDCESYESSRPTENPEEDERERDIARVSFQRYINFCEGWITSESSRASAVEDLKTFQNIHLNIFYGILGYTEKELNFLVDAQLQLVECYQLLKWTYVYGYFMSEDESSKKHLFEFMQEQAKYLVGLLKKQIEELDMFLYVDVSPKQFKDFRRLLLSLTSTTKEYYVKMVDALRAGLPEVAAIPSPSLKPSQAPRMLQEERDQDDSPSPGPGPKAVREEGQFGDASTSTKTSLEVIKRGNA